MPTQNTVQIYGYYASYVQCTESRHRIVDISKHGLPDPSVLSRCQNRSNVKLQYCTEKRNPNRFPSRWQFPHINLSSVARQVGSLYRVRLRRESLAWNPSVKMARAKALGYHQVWRNSPQDEEQYFQQRIARLPKCDLCKARWPWLSGYCATMPARPWERRWVKILQCWLFQHTSARGSARLSILVSFVLYTYAEIIWRSSSEYKSCMTTSRQNDVASYPHEHWGLAPIQIVSSSTIRNETYRFEHVHKVLEHGVHDRIIFRLK